MFAFWPVFAVILPECGEEAEDWKKLSGCLERASTDLVIRIAVLLSQSTDVPAVLSRLRLRKKLSAEVQMVAAVERKFIFTAAGINEIPFAGFGAAKRTPLD